MPTASEPASRSNVSSRDAVSHAGARVSVRLSAGTWLLDGFFLVLAACVVVGGWRRPTVPWLAAGAVGSILVGFVTLGSVSDTLAARADYGLDGWSGIAGGRAATTAGDAGFYVRPVGGAVDFTVSTSDPTGSASPVLVDVMVGGARVQRVVVGGERLRLRYPSRGRGVSFVEVRPRATPPLRPPPLRDHPPGVGR